ncbi:MAG: acetoin utilization protein AcuC [Nitrososphaerales archaeon]
MCSVAVFFGEASSTYSFPSGHPMSGVRAKAFWSEMEEQGLNKAGGVKIRRPVPASEEDLRLFHTGEYIDFVKKSSEAGVGLLDYGDTPVFKGIFEASSYVVGSTLRGLDMVMRKEVEHVFNPIGGLHHARRDSAAGFCVFNDAAIAIIQAESKYGLKRILYVDIDAHHGDGVFYAFYDDPKVFVADIHEDGRFLYPGTGSEDEKGEGAAEGTKLPIPLPPSTDDERFKEAFKQVEDFASRVEPELVLFQCGGDGLMNDPITHLRYTPEAHRYAAESLHQIAHKFSKGRILAMGGGGYNSENTAKAWVEVVKAFLEPAVD